MVVLYVLLVTRLLKLMEENKDIVDASKVISQAVRNSIGIASTILTASAVVHLVEPTPQEIAWAVATNNNQAFTQN